jgi:hypothetical protein
MSVPSALLALNDGTFRLRCSEHPAATRVEAVRCCIFGLVYFDIKIQFLIANSPISLKRDRETKVTAGELQNLVAGVIAVYNLHKKTLALANMRYLNFA